MPVGKDEHGNLEIKRWGTPVAIADPKDHVELGTKLGILDLDRAAKMSGARFSVLKGLGRQAGAGPHQLHGRPADPRPAGTR